MTISAVRLNHAVLFVVRPRPRAGASTPTCSASRSSPASPAPTPRSCGCRGSRNHHDLGLFGSARPRRPRRPRGGRPLPPGLAGRHDRRPRAGPPDAARRRRVHRRVQPRRHQERLRRRPRRQRVRGHVDAAPRRLGRVWSTAPDRPPRPRRRGAPLGRPSVRRAGSSRRQRVTGVRRARRDVPRRRPTPTRPLVVLLHGRGSNEERDHRAGRPPARGPGLRRGARADRRGRRLRLVRQPRHRPARSPSRSPRRWPGSAAGSTTRTGPGRCVLVGFSGGAAFAGGLLLADPQRCAGAAILLGTLPFDAGVPVRRGASRGCRCSSPRATPTP